MPLNYIMSYSQKRIVY